jgi:hypothetical protein
MNRKLTALFCSLFTVQGKEYFKCPDNYGIFVRQSQIVILDEKSGSPSPTKPARPLSDYGGLRQPTSALKKERVWDIVICI